MLVTKYVVRSFIRKIRKILSALSTLSQLNSELSALSCSKLLIECLETLSELFTKQK
jgi:hypothetical protein